MVKPAPLIAIVGETASGKSRIALELAKKYNGEIIAADSWTIYRGLNIGTAKPSQAEQAEINHHLIDIVSPDEDFTAALYKDLANKAITEIASRKHLPIIVGGTGLYVDSVLFDFSFLPVGNNRLRSELEAMSLEDLVKRAQHEGYDLAGIDLRNTRRVRRLIETGGERPQKSELRGNTLVIGVKIPRAKLRANIESRVEIMFRKGLRREVEELVDKYGWSSESLKGIGYAEFRGYFDGQQSMAETKRKIVRNTLNLAKRQRTWFKRNQNIEWVENVAEADALVAKFINASASV